MAYRSQTRADPSAAEVDSRAALYEDLPGRYDWADWVAGALIVGILLAGALAQYAHLALFPLAD